MLLVTPFFTSGLSGNMPITFLHIICITNCLIVMLGAIWLCILCSIGQSRAYYMPPLDFRIKISEAQIWIKDRNGIILLSIVEIILRLTSFLTKIFNGKLTPARVLMIGWLKSFIQISTVRNNWVSTRPCLCSNSSIFKVPWQILKVKPQLSSLNPSLPYLRAFEWGTVWPHTSRGIKNTTG